MRDEDAAKFSDYKFMREQDRVRKIVIGNCKLKNTPMEKNGAYELVPKVSNLLFFTIKLERRQVLRVRSAKKPCE